MVGEQWSRRADEYGRRVGLRHDIVTRMNTPHREGLNRDPSWLRYRVDLFRKYAAASIDRQTVRTFNWTVWIDLDTPDDFFDEIAEIVESRNGRCIWDRRKFDANAFERLCHSDYFGIEARDLPEWIVTTRLDSDDSLAPDFVKLVQAECVLCFDRDDDFRVILENGCLYDEQTGRMFKAEGGSDLFVTHASKVKDSEVGFVDNCYTNPRDCRNARNAVVRSTSAWMKVFHEKNCISKLEVGRLGSLDPSVLGERFGICGETA